MNIQKIFERIAIFSSCVLFVATSEQRAFETYGPSDIPYQRITTNTPIGYQCTSDFSGGETQEFYLTNMSSNTHTVNIAVRKTAHTDTGLDEGEWKELPSIELEGTTPSDRHPVIYPILEDEIIDDIGTSPQTIDFMLYGNPDEEVDIIVEGHYWGLCSILEMSEEN